MDAKKLRAVTIICFLLGVIFFMVSLLSPQWAWVNQVTQINQQGVDTANIYFTYTYGLFKTCFSTVRCVDLGWDLSSDLLKPVFLTRVVMVIAICDLIFCAIAEGYVIIWKKFYNKHIMIFTGLLKLLAGILVFVAVISFVALFTVTTNKDNVYSFGYCFYLALLAILSFLGSGILTIYETRATSPQTPSRKKRLQEKSYSKTG